MTHANLSTGGPPPISVNHQSLNRRSVRAHAGAAVAFVTGPAVVDVCMALSAGSLRTLLYGGSAHFGENDDFRSRIRRLRRAWTCRAIAARRSEEHTSELQSLMRISYAVFCLKKKNNI